MQSRKPLAVCAVFNFLKSNMQNTLHSFIFFSESPVFIGGQRVMGAISPFITLNQKRI